MSQQRTAADASTFAVWTGRFQPPHEGHFAILRHSLDALPLPHVVVLTAHFGWHTGGGYGELARAAYQAERNPFTPWERAALMRLALEGHGLEHQVSVMVAPRHDLDWALVEGFYPPKRVICLTDKDEFERAKAEIWRARRQHVRVFSELGPDVLTTSAIRRRVEAGHDWRRYLHPACHAYFREIDGPRRAFGVAARDA